MRVQHCAPHSHRSHAVRLNCGLKRPHPRPVPGSVAAFFARDRGIETNPRREGGSHCQEYWYCSRRAHLIERSFRILKDSRFLRVNSWHALCCSRDLTLEITQLPLVSEKIQGDGMRSTSTCWLLTASCSTQSCSPARPRSSTLPGAGGLSQLPPRELASLIRLLAEMAISAGFTRSATPLGKQTGFAHSQRV